MYSNIFTDTCKIDRYLRYEKYDSLKHTQADVIASRTSRFLKSVPCGRQVIRNVCLSDVSRSVLIASHNKCYPRWSGIVINIRVEINESAYQRS